MSVSVDISVEGGEARGCAIAFVGFGRGFVTALVAVGLSFAGGLGIGFEEDLDVCGCFFFCAAVEAGRIGRNWF